MQKKFQERRDKATLIRWTPAEFERADGYAHGAGLDFAVYIRRTVLEGAVKSPRQLSKSDRELLATAISALNNVGASLRTMLAALEFNDFPVADFDTGALQTIKSASAHIREALVELEMAGDKILEQAR